MAESSDGSGFWYVNDQRERASAVHTYRELESMTGCSRKKLCYPVVCSKKRSRLARAELCGMVGQPGHESADSPAHIVPGDNFLERVEQLFRRPATSGATSSAAKRP